jgi:hypothetical protein
MSQSLSTSPRQGHHPCTLEDYHHELQNTQADHLIVGETPILVETTTQEMQVTLSLADLPHQPSQ